MGEKLTWSSEQHKCLLESCIEEVKNVGRKGLSLQKESWIKIGRILKENFGKDLTQKQIRNSYDNLKAKYTGWVYLKNKTDNIYNPQTNTFNLTPEEWDEFKKGHPKAGSLKTSPLPYPELCAILFDGNSATGNLRWTSSQTTYVVGSSTCQVRPLQLTGTPPISIDDDDDISHHSSEPFPEPPPVDRPNKRAKPTTASHDPHSRSSITSDELALEMKKALQHLTKGPTHEECVKKLEIAALDPLDPLSLAAYNIFGVSPGMKESWILLPDNPEVLKRMAKDDRYKFRTYQVVNF